MGARAARGVVTGIEHFIIATPTGKLKSARRPSVLSEEVEELERPAITTTGPDGNETL